MRGLLIDFFAEKPYTNSNQRDWSFKDDAMHKHGNMGQGIYVDPQRDFCAVGFGTADNTSGIDYAPGFMRAAAKMLNGE